MNCSDVESTLDELEHTLQETDGGFAVVIIALASTSILLLVQGERVVRPVGALVGALAAGIGTLILTDLIDIPCWVRFLLSAAAAVLAALLVLCIFKTGLFVLGAAGFGAIGHYVYEAIPTDSVTPPFVIAGRSAYYYLTILVTSVAGGVIARLQKPQFVRISSSLLGGAGVAMASHLVAERTANQLPALALLAIMLLCAIVGVWVQHVLAKKRASAGATPEQRV